MSCTVQFSAGLGLVCFGFSRPKAIGLDVWHLVIPFGRRETWLVESLFVKGGLIRSLSSLHTFTRLIGLGLDGGRRILLLLLLSELLLLNVVSDGFVQWSTACRLSISSDLSTSKGLDQQLDSGGILGSRGWKVCRTRGRSRRGRGHGGWCFHAFCCGLVRE